MKKRYNSFFSEVASILLFLHRTEGVFQFHSVPPCAIRLYHNRLSQNTTAEKNIDYPTSLITVHALVSLFFESPINFCQNSCVAVFQTFMKFQFKIWSPPGFSGPEGCGCPWDAYEGGEAPDCCEYLGGKREKGGGEAGLDPVWRLMAETAQLCVALEKKCPQWKMDGESNLWMLKVSLISPRDESSSFIGYLARLVAAVERNVLRQFTNADSLRDRFGSFCVNHPDVCHLPVLVRSNAS